MSKLLLVIRDVNERPVLESMDIETPEVCDAWTLELYSDTEHCVVAKDTTFTTVVAHDEDFNQQLFYLLTPDTGIAPNA